MPEKDNSVDAAIDNLNAIKQGNDPRTTEQPDEPSVDGPSLDSDDSLELARAEVNRLITAHDLDVTTSQLDVVVARWDRHNGYAKYHQTVDEHRFGKRMTNYRAVGNHIIAINERILEESGRDQFLDTVRHELAHIEAYVRTGESQEHNNYWKRLASELGADPSSTHHKKSVDHNYYYGCPECGQKAGRLRKSKKVKHPGRYICTDCKVNMVSWAVGKEMPTEPGTTNL